MKKNLIIMLLVQSMIFLSCVTFSPIDIDTTLPNDIKNRMLYKDTAQWKYHLDELVGSIIYEKDNGEYSIGKRIIKDGTKLVKDPLDLAQAYHLFINDKADASLSMLAFAGGSISQEQKAEIKIVDILSYFIVYNDFDLGNIKKEFNLPLPKGYKNRYYIQGAILSSVTKNIYQSATKGINTHIVGTGISADGSIYSGSIKSVEAPDFFIGITVRDQADIDLLINKKDRVELITKYSGVINVLDNIIQ